jgi:uncharacterized membrane protein YedE/YeeE
MDHSEISQRRSEHITARSSSVDTGHDARKLGKEAAKTNQWPWVNASAATLAQAAVFGIAFGFLLQKGGVAKFDILVGVLLLENFVVVKVMLSAIIVGMIGVHFLERAGVLEFQIKETVYGSNILGGLMFGIGFGLIAYCPGTNATAVGQGNLDAIVGVLGMVLGSYLFALASKHTSGTISKWGDRGKITLSDLLGISRGATIALFVPLLILVLLGVEYFLPDWVVR